MGYYLIQVRDLIGRLICSLLPPLERHLVTCTLVLRSYNTYCDAELDIILDIDISNAGSSEFGNNNCPYNHLSACFNGCRLAHGIICYGHWYLGKIHRKWPGTNRKWAGNERYLRCHCVWHMYLLQWWNMPWPILSKNLKLTDWQDGSFQFHSPYLGMFSFIQEPFQFRWLKYSTIKLVK